MLAGRSVGQARVSIRSEIAATAVRAEAQGQLAVALDEAARILQRLEAHPQAKLVSRELWQARARLGRARAKLQVAQAA